LFKVEIFTLIRNDIMYYTAIRNFTNIVAADKFANRMLKQGTGLHCAITFTKGTDGFIL
jgi:hypothetical protein